MTSVVFRIPTGIWLIIICSVLNIRAENVEIVTPENTKTVTEEPKNVTATSNDSYVRAYQEIQKLRTGPAKRNDFSQPPDKDKHPDDYNTVIRSSHLSDDKYPSLTLHPSAPPPEHPQDTFPPSQPLPYGPPHFHDAPSAPHGPPHHAHHHEPLLVLPHYAPPHAHHPHPPPTHCRPTPYSSPSTSLFGLLPKKLSFKLLVKILLKLVLFKMIVKFIAVICLLLFIPLLKSKGASASAEQEDDRARNRALDAMASMIWDSIYDQNSLYDGDGNMKDIGDIVQQVDDDDDDQDNYFSRPLKAVRFLEFCVSTVDRVIGYTLSVLNKQRTGGDDLGSFVLDKLQSFFANM